MIRPLVGATIYLIFRHTIPESLRFVYAFEGLPFKNQCAENRHSYYIFIWSEFQCPLIEDFLNFLVELSMNRTDLQGMWTSSSEPLARG